MNLIKRLSARQQLLALVVCSLLLIVWVNPGSLYFLNDDFDSLPLYAQGQFFHNRGTRLFAELSLFADARLYSFHPMGYIVSNLLIHLGCCWLGFTWCRKMAGSFKVDVDPMFLLAGLIGFMWFAFHSETVFWAISRTASLALLCFFGCWLCFFKAVGDKRWLLPAFVLVLCGLFSYENLLLLPLQLVLWHLLLPKDAIERKHTKWPILSSMAAIVLYLPIRRYITLEWVGSYEAENVFAFKFLTLARNFYSLLCRTLVAPMQNKWLVLMAGSLLLLVLLFVAIRVVRTKRANGWWYFLLLNWIGSYLFYVSLGIDLSGYESERYLYIPSFFFCAWLLYTVSLLALPGIWKQAIAIVFILYQVIFFSLALTHFREAGELAAKVISTVQESQTGNTPEKTLIYNLPDKAFGVPLFRLGINNGLAWLHPGTDTSSILVASRLLQAKAADPVFLQKKLDSIGILTIKFFPLQFNK